MEERLHLKGLNGIRTIAAVCVVLSHLRVLLPEFPVIQGNSFDMTNYAVTMFFTLSGFLITYLLFMEKKKKEISIKNFYIRRILRIWPLYFTYLALAFITIYIYEPGKLPGALPYYLFFAANVPSIFNTHLPHLAQYWSLGVEEQFYIFWPWLMKRSRNALKALIIFTVCFFLLVLFSHITNVEWNGISLLRVLEINRFECMSIGGIAALLCLQRHDLFIKTVTHPFTQVICWLSLLLMFVNKFHIPYFPDNGLVALVTCGLIVNLSFNKKTLISLENRFFDLLGKVSYGIYIIHPVVIFYYGMLLEKINTGTAGKLLLVYGGVLLLTVLFAWLSYELLEKIFLRLKDNFSTIKSADSRYSD